MKAAVELRGLRFDYGNGGAPVFGGLDLVVPQGSRTLLVGANGVGKSTLLKLIAGRHLLAPETLKVFGKSPFHDLDLSARVAFVDGDFPLHLDLRVEELLGHPIPDRDPKLERELIELLEVDHAWRMNRVSEGQRRRVQLLLALRRRVELLLLDEVTAHLDVVVRADLLEWIKRSKITVIYATHIFDGLFMSHSDPWLTHLAFLRFGQPLFFAETAAVPELQPAANAGYCSPLLTLCERWIREDSRGHR